MEYLYPINLPNIDKILLKKFIFPKANFSNKGIFWYNPTEIFESYFLENLQDLGVTPLSSVLFFSDSYRKGTPHIDGTKYDVGVWSLNWNIGSKMKMIYYETESNIEKESTYTLFERSSLNSIKEYSGYEKFIVRTDMIHSIENIENRSRWAITLRGHPKESWGDCVDFFKKSKIID